MRFEFIADRRTKVKTFLKGHDVSKGLLAKVKFKGGNIWVVALSKCHLFIGCGRCGDDWNS